MRRGYEKGGEWGGEEDGDKRKMVRRGDGEGEGGEI